MEIATRETGILETFHYNDGSTKKTKIYEMYTGYMKTPVLRYKIVRFILPDGTIDDNRSYDSRLLIDESEEFDTEYTNLYVHMVTNINYYNECTKTIKIHKDPKQYTISAKLRSIDNSIYYKRLYIRTYKSSESDVEHVNYFRTLYTLYDKNIMFPKFRTFETA